MYGYIHLHTHMHRYMHINACMYTYVHTYMHCYILIIFMLDVGKCACILIDVYITPNGSGLNKNQTRVGLNKNQTRVTQGGLRGSEIQKSGISTKRINQLTPNGWTDWHQIWYMSADSSGNGHRLKKLAPRYPRAGACCGFRWPQCHQKFEECHDLQRKNENK